MGVLRRKRRKDQIGPDPDSGLHERLLDSDESDDYQPKAKRSKVTVLDQAVKLFTYLVGKVAEYIIPSAFGWFGSSSAKKLSELQSRRLFELKARVGVKFDQDSHGKDLEKLWSLAFPDLPFVEGKTKQWQEMGWQSDHPSSDFRGGGYLALECLVYLAERKPLVFQRLCFKTQGKRSDWEYPFGAAGVNLTFMLRKVLDLVDGAKESPPSTKAGRSFLALLDIEEERYDTSFEELFCSTFELLDKIWLEDKADYMQFPSVMKKVEDKVTKIMSKGAPLSSLEQYHEDLLG